MNLLSESTVPLNRESLTKAFPQQVTMVIGGGKGDEGKGGDAFAFAEHGDYQLIVSPVGGPNAGHTVYADDGKMFVGHNMPGGALSGKPVFLGQGKYIHMGGLKREIQQLHNLGANPKIYIASGAHIILDSFHKKLDGAIEQEKKKGGNEVGTTQSGIGPGVATRGLRDGIRIGQISHNVIHNNIVSQLIFPWNQDIGFDRNEIEREIMYQKSILDELIQEGVVEVVGDDFAKKLYQTGDNILIEGAQSPSLGMYGGAYPKNTSTDTSFLGILTSLGMMPIPGRVGQILTVKAFPSAVGSHIFPERVSHIHPELAQAEAKFGLETGEFGASTGRPREIAYPSSDLVGQYLDSNFPYVSAVSLRKLDYMDKFRRIIGGTELPIVVSYDSNGKPVLSMIPHNNPERLIEEYRKSINYYIPGEGTIIPFILGFGPKPRDSMIQIPQ